jgi:hypothetical protein
MPEVMSWPEMDSMCPRGISFKCLQYFGTFVFGVSTLHGFTLDFKPHMISTLRMHENSRSEQPAESPPLQF